MRIFFTSLIIIYFLLFIFFMIYLHHKMNALPLNGALNSFFYNGAGGCSQFRSRILQRKNCSHPITCESFEKTVSLF